MISDILSSLFKMGLQGCFWACVFSIKIDGYAVYDHVRDRVLTEDVVEIFAQTIEDLWAELGGEDMVPADTSNSLEKYGSYQR